MERQRRLSHSVGEPEILCRISPKVEPINPLQNMKNNLLFYVLFGIALLIPKAYSDNPIRNGLPEYGIRDCHILYDKHSYFLVGTEIAPPGEEKKGITLYASSDLKKWRKQALLISRDSIPVDSRFRDGWDSPELHHIRGRYILSFGGRNNSVNPYSPTEIVLAVSESIRGPYRIVTPEPIVKGNRFTLMEDTDGQVYAYWELDGSLYGAPMNENLDGLAREPQMLLAPRQLRADDRFLDAPSVLKLAGTYYLFYTVFKGGYYAAYATSDSPLGAWSSRQSDILFYRSEDQAPTQLRGTYAAPLTFAPPCEIIGNIQLFRGKGKRWYIAYHSEDKYAEPFLCIDSATVVPGEIKCNISLP